MTSEAGEDVPYVRVLAQFDQYFVELATSAAMLGCTREEAEDLVHDAILAMIRRNPALDPIDNERAWLHRVVRNKAIDILKNRQRHEPIDRQARESDQRAWETPEGSLEVKETLQTIDNLPDDLRRVVVLAYQGRSRAEIAESEGITVHAAKKRLSRGLHELRRRLGDAAPTSRGATGERRNK